jgi:hypothetical protein
MVEDLGEVAVEVVAEVLDATLPDTVDRRRRYVLLWLFAFAIMVGIVVWLLWRS